MSNHTNAASLTQRVGRAVALLGVVLPLLWIGGMKFTQIEIDALQSITRAALVGSALAALTFLVTSSLFLVLPVSGEQAGGFPVLNKLGQFLLKDVALLGIAFVIGAEALARVQQLKLPQQQQSVDEHER
jgi:uncharacterized membrane protein YkgB